MIIAIDAYEATAPHRVGVGRYAYEIIRHLHAVSEKLPAGRRPEFRLYSPFPRPSGLPKPSAWWTYRRVPVSRFWTFVGLPLALATDQRADVVFSPTHYIPRFIPIPKVVSVMDLSYLSYPELFRKKDLYQLRHWTAYAVRHARRVITISSFSKDAIIDTYRIPEGRVTVTYPGLTPFAEDKDMQKTDISTKYGIGKHYILSLGTIQPRKNYRKLIEAFGIFLEKNRQKFGAIQLVIVGKKGWLYEEILNAPRAFGLTDRVVFLDFVPDSDLPELYKHALCFALPSLYEGFGLPVLEAMSYGCPVVVSNTSSLPEIAGRAGIYVHPEDPASIAKGLLAAVRQRNLMQGRWRKEKGLAQVKKFSWEDAAKKTLEVLENAASR